MTWHAWLWRGDAWEHIGEASGMDLAFSLLLNSYPDAPNRFYAITGGQYPNWTPRNPKGR